MTLESLTCFGLTDCVSLLCGGFRLGLPPLCPALYGSCVEGEVLSIVRESTSTVALTVKEDDLSRILANMAIRAQEGAAENQSGPEQSNLLRSPSAGSPISELSQTKSGDFALDVCREQISGDTRLCQNPAQHHVAAGLVI